MKNNECTVLIITYNRPNHLKRALSYYCRGAISFPIVVADSSSEEIKKLNKQTVALLNSSYILYLDKYSSDINPATKIVDVLKHVDTEYCVLCADDDFISSIGIYEAVTFLAQSPNYVSAYGNYVWFSFRYNKQGKPCFTYKYLESQSTEQESSQDRLIHRTICGNEITLYSVQRTDFMKISIGQASEIAGNLQSIGAYRQTVDLLFVELLISLLPPIYGKMKCLDTLSHMREASTPQDTSRVYITLPDLMDEPSYKAKLQEFLCCLAGHLSKQSNIDLNEAHRIAKEAMSAYTTRVPSFVLVVNRIVKKLHLPTWIDFSIRKIYRIAADLRYPIIGSGHTFPLKYNNELEQVHLCILSSAKEIYRR